jgi:hypothetical protein
MLRAAFRRIVVLLGLALGVTIVGALALGLLAGSSVNRSLTLGFYLMGCFMLIAGFFVGNRGPTRVRGEVGSASMFGLPLPGSSTRRIRWATLGEQNETINNSAIYIFLGLVLVAIGVVIDSHQSVF